ncbi:MAG: 3-phosphoglycerate dehydrogenase [Oscillospiraceae bacterium]|nr:3-phosphoglycerate dehydrogenase [Oscillospiraceae bacterium]
MIRIKVLNNISDFGITELQNKGCEVGFNVTEPHGILVRSADMHKMEFGKDLLCISRAGAGYNNIPTKRCAEEGIVVFNAPGANAEAVKELALCELVLAGRDVIGSIDWVKTLADEAPERISDIVERNKGAFAGPELMGKTIGVVGLGATGAAIANMCLDLGMQVYGHDPYMSVEAAWRLSRDVVRAEDITEIYRRCDYISINVPYTEQTKGMFNDKAFSLMKDGVRIINESRAEVVDDDAMLRAIANNKVAKYVTDFPTAKLIGQRNVICLPHIGACTPESEDKCAVAAARELYDYIVNGNIRNSVNLPDAVLDDRQGVCRLCIIHMNVPRMLTRFLEIIGGLNINVEHMINKSRGEFAYTMIDLGDPIDLEQIKAIVDMEEVLRVRIL